MRHNGLIYNQILVGGGIDGNGEPIPAEQAWGEPIPCVVTTNSDSRKGKYEDGMFRQASFTILLEGVVREPLSRIRLRREQEEVGEFDVLSVEPLSTIGRTKVIV